MAGWQSARLKLSAGKWSAADEQAERKDGPSCAVAASWLWAALEKAVRDELRTYPGSVQAYLTHRNPLWNLVGRVCFHLQKAAAKSAFLKGLIAQASAGQQLGQVPASAKAKELRRTPGWSRQQGGAGVGPGVRAGARTGPGAGGRNRG